MILLLRIK